MSLIGFKEARASIGPLVGQVVPLIATRLGHVLNLEVAHGHDYLLATVHVVVHGGQIELVDGHAGIHNRTIHHRLRLVLIRRR